MSAPQIPKRPAKIIVDQIMNRVPPRPVIFPVWKNVRREPIFPDAIEVPAREPIFPIKKIEVPARVPIFPVYRIGEKEVKDYLSSIYSSIPESTTSRWIKEKCEEHFQAKIKLSTKTIHRIFREVDEEN